MCRLESEGFAWPGLIHVIGVLVSEAAPLDRVLIWKEQHFLVANSVQLCHVAREHRNNTKPRDIEYSGFVHTMCLCILSLMVRAWWFVDMRFLVFCSATSTACFALLRAFTSSSSSTSDFLRTAALCLCSLTWCSTWLFVRRRTSSPGLGVGCMGLSDGTSELTCNRSLWAKLTVCRTARADWGRHFNPAIISCESKEGS